MSGQRHKLIVLRLGQTHKANSVMSGQMRTYMGPTLVQIREISG